MTELEKLNEIELKALLYDNIIELQRINRNVQILENRLIQLKKENKGVKND